MFSCFSRHAGQHECCFSLKTYHRFVVGMVISDVKAASMHVCVMSLLSLAVISFMHLLSFLALQLFSFLLSSRRATASSSWHPSSCSPTAHPLCNRCCCATWRATYPSCWPTWRSPTAGRWTAGSLTRQTPLPLPLDLPRPPLQLSSVPTPSPSQSRLRGKEVQSRLPPSPRLVTAQRMAARHGLTMRAMGGG